MVIAGMLPNTFASKARREARVHMSAEVPRIVICAPRCCNRNSVHWALTGVEAAPVLLARHFTEHSIDDEQEYYSGARSATHGGTFAASSGPLESSCRL